MESIGSLKIVTNYNIYSASIKCLVGEDTKGKYFSGNYYEPPEYPELIYEYGIAECDGIKEDEDIEYIEIESIERYAVEINPDVEVIKIYDDFHSGAGNKIIEFKEAG